MSSNREDYPAYLARLNVTDGPTAPLHILSRTRGLRPTDPFEVFPSPLAASELGRRFRTTFFVHGLRHGPDTAQKRVASLGPGDPLFPMLDWCNPQDPQAIALRTEDRHLIGYVPRYYVGDVLRIPRRADIRFTVERMNPPPAPAQQRVLCAVDAPWSHDEAPLSDGDYRPLSD